MRADQALRQDGLHAVETQLQHDTGKLLRALGDTDVDDHGNEHHGLAWWYPQVKLWPTVRSVGGGGGGGKPGTALPLNAEALDFIGSTYWVGESSLDRCSDGELDDPSNYRAGFEPTVLGLERSVRRALGHLDAPRLAPAADVLSPVPAVVAALTYLRTFAPEIAAQPFLLELVLEEALRLAVRARGMMHGSRWSAGRGPCPHCHQVESVISDEDRAVCINTLCRNADDGSRHCWRYDAETGWVEVPEPDVRGRGQVSDEKLSRWADVG
jgi:hypothetical protein